MLDKLKLGACKSKFAQERIDWETLLELTEAELKDLGVDRLGDRKRLLREIRKNVESEEELDEDEDEDEDDDEEPRSPPPWHQESESE